MDDKILVHVAGPRLLAQGICALLNGFPDIGAEVAVPKALTIERKSPVYLMLLPHLRQSAVLELNTSNATTSNAIQSDQLRLPQQYSMCHVAMVTTGTDFELVTKCAGGVQVFLSIGDDRTVLREGVVAASRSAGYCSPKLTDGVINDLDRHSVEISYTDPERGHVLLSQRQSDVADLVSSGLSNSEIAAQLHVSVHTVKTHVAAVLRKLGARRRGQVAKMIGSI